MHLCRNETRQLVKHPVGVEKVHFPRNTEKMGDRKCLRKPRKSFVGFLTRSYFREFRGKEFFQHPRLISPTNATRSASFAHLRLCDGEHTKARRKEHSRCRKKGESYFRPARCL